MSEYEMKFPTARKFETRWITARVSLLIGERAYESPLLTLRLVLVDNPRKECPEITGINEIFLERHFLTITRVPPI